MIFKSKFLKEGHYVYLVGQNALAEGKQKKAALFRAAFCSLKIIDVCECRGSRALFLAVLFRDLDPDHGPEQIDARLLIILLLKLFAQQFFCPFLCNALFREVYV